MNFRVIYAVAKKDLTQMLRYPVWIIQLLIWPLIFPLVYILSALGYAGPDESGLQVFKTLTGTSNYAGYIMVGTMIWMMVNTTMWNFGSYLRDEQVRGTLESNWLCPINKYDFLIGGSVISFFISIFTLVISMIEYRFIYQVRFSGNVFTWLFLFIIIMPGVYGVGSMLAGLVLKLKEVNAAVNVVRGIMMIVCGITFPITVMPGFLRTISKFIPYTYGIQAARQIMINGESLSAASHSIVMCLLEGVITMILGRIIFNSIEKQIKVSGSLDRF